MRSPCAFADTGIGERICFEAHSDGSTATRSTLLGVRLITQSWNGAGTRAVDRQTKAAVCRFCLAKSGFVGIISKKPILPHGV